MAKKKNEKQNNIPQQTIESKEYDIIAILAIIFGFLFPPLGLLFGIISLQRIKKNPNLQGKGLAIIGIVMGILTLIATVVIIIWVFSLPTENTNFERCSFPDYTNGIECQNFSANAVTDEIYLDLKNNKLDNITITGITYDGYKYINQNSCYDFVPVTIFPGSVQQVTCRTKTSSTDSMDIDSIDLISGVKQRIYMTIFYYVGNYTFEYKISGKVILTP
jgi:uncharacterized Tic20 family protein